MFFYFLGCTFHSTKVESFNFLSLSTGNESILMWTLVKRIQNFDVGLLWIWGFEKKKEKKKQLCLTKVTYKIKVALNLWPFFLFFWMWTWRLFRCNYVPIFFRHCAWSDQECPGLARTTFARGRRWSEILRFEDGSARWCRIRVQEPEGVWYVDTRCLKASCYCCWEEI